MELPQRHDEVQISDYFRVLFRRRFVALLSFFTVFVSVAIHTFLATPVYEAQSTIQIKDENKKNLLSEIVQLDQTNPIAAEMEIIKSRSVAEEVVRNLRLDTDLQGFPAGVGLEFEDLDVGPLMKGKLFTLTFQNDAGDYVVSSKDGVLGKGSLTAPFSAKADDPKRYVKFNFHGAGAVSGVWFRFVQLPFRQAVRQVQTSTEVQAIGEKTQILRVYFQDPNPRRSSDIVNAVVDTYRRRNIDENAKEARETLRFIETQKDLVQKQLSGSEEALRNYKTDHNVISLPEEATSVIQSYAKFAVERSQLDIETQNYQAILNSLKGDKSAGFGLPSIEMENSMLTNMGLKLSELQTKKQELLSQFTETYPDVVALQMQIDELKEKISQVVKNTIKAATARKAEIDKVLDQYNVQLKSLPDKERDLAELVRSREVSSEIYTFLLKKREEARITEAATIGNIRVIDEAEQPIAPIKPNIRLNLMLALIAGILLAIGVAFFLEFIDDSLKSNEEVERYIKKPIFGIIPRIPDQRRQEGEEALPVSRNLVTHHSPKSPISEAFRTLRTNIYFANPDRPLTEILITSAGPSEGKSTIVSNLALTIANTGKRTLLIDCDLRKPNAHNFFDMSRDPGITSILSGGMKPEEVIRTTPIENLFVLPAGPIPPNPTEILSSKAMKDLMDAFRRDFDMILLDSPPVVAVTDAAILSSFVHSTLLVVELGRARASGVNRAVDLLEKVNANLLGLVTNNISAGFRYDYGYYSYYYYYTESGEKKKRRKRRRYGY